MESKNTKFVPENCKYNPDRDISPVVPSDVLDLADCYVNGVIPNNVVIPDSDYDGNDEPSNVWKRPSNDFEAMHMLESIKQVKSSAKSKAEVE